MVKTSGLSYTDLSLSHSSVLKFLQQTVKQHVGKKYVNSSSESANIINTSLMWTILIPVRVHSKTKHRHSMYTTTKQM